MKSEFRNILDLYEKFTSIEGQELGDPERVTYAAPSSLHSGVSRRAYGPALRRAATRLSGGGETEYSFSLEKVANQRWYLKVICLLEDWETYGIDLVLTVNGALLHHAQAEFVENVCQGWPALYYEIPQKLLRDGENRVVIKTEDSCHTGLLVAGLSLLALPERKPLQQTSCVRCVRAGQKFSVALMAGDSEELGEVQVSEHYRFLGALSLRGFWIYQFLALTPGQGCGELLFGTRRVPLALPEVFTASADTCLVGIDSDDHRHDCSEEADRIPEVFAMTGMGNLIQFRPSTGRTHLHFAPREVWEERIAFLLAMQAKIGIADTRAHLMDFMPELAGGQYVGSHIHEPYLYFCYPLEHTANRDIFMVNTEKLLSAESFGEAEQLYRSVLRETREKNATAAGLSSIGSPSLLCVYEADAQFDRLTLEPVSNLNLLTAAGHGCTSPGCQWGAHIPIDWYFGSPNDACKSRKFRLAMHYLYLSGADYLYTENAVFKTNAFSREDWEAPFCATNRQYLREFYDYTIAHPRNGTLQIEKAVIYGRHEHFYWYTDDRMAELQDVQNWDRRVWGKWEDDHYRRCWNALEAWLPAASHQAVNQAPENRRLFSGTPYGSVDIIGWDGNYEQYPLLVLLGWNTMCDEMLEKLRSYVENGGTLFFSCCHLNMTDRNDWEKSLLLDARVEKLLGAVFGSGVSHASCAAFIDGAEFTSGRPLEIVPLQPEGAQVLAASETGEPLFLRHSYGKGAVYYSSFAEYFSEDWAIGATAHLLQKLGESQGTVCDNPNIAFTKRLLENGETVIDALNMNCLLEDGVEYFKLTLPGKELHGAAREGSISTYRL